MNKTDIVNKFSRTAHRVGFKLKKHSPEILVVAGVAGTVASTVMACKATTKLDKILAEKKEQLEQVDGYIAENGYSEEYTEEDAKKDKGIIAIKSYVNVAKVYAPAVVVGTVSIAAILGGHHILHKRNIALGAAYATVNRTFKDYRGRVVERFGENLDKELRYNIKSKEVEEIEVDGKGKEKAVKKNVEMIDSEYLNEIGDYAKFFDQSCAAWTKDPEANMVFLKQQQAYANRKLQSQGYLFLNDVYEMLGLDRTRAGQVMGWTYDMVHPKGANEVDFGIYKTHRANRAFVNGYEPVILLDFNVDEESILDYL